MPLPKKIKTTLLTLLKNSRSFQSLPKEEQQDKQKRLLALPQDRLLVVIQALEDEQAKVASLEQKLESCEKELKSLLPLVKQASAHLQKAFIALREKEEIASTEKKNQSLLQDLENA